jgi:hypothetical protein
VRLKIRNQEDFWAGLLFIGIGIVAVVVASDYPMGSAMRMGPGYFPTYLGAIMIVLGALVSLFSFSMEEATVTPFAWKAAILLSVSFLVFGWGIDHIGFIPSLFALLVLCAAAGKRFRLLEVLLLSVVLIAGAVGIFIYGIELPFPLFWWR